MPGASATGRFAAKPISAQPSAADRHVANRRDVRAVGTVVLCVYVAARRNPNVDVVKYFDEDSSLRWFPEDPWQWINELCSKRAKYYASESFVCTQDDLYLQDVIQNAIDGAEAYMKSVRPQLQRQQLCQAEKIWYLAKMNPPKKF